MASDPHKYQIDHGSNMFELIEFSLERRLDNGTIVRGRYGVNVAKVREVIRLPKINQLASSIQGVEGIFELRGIPIPVVNLGKVLGDKSAPVKPTHQVIVAEFSQKRAGFIVETTNRIRRVEWSRVKPSSSGESSSTTGMILVENNEFLFILDLEKILEDLENLAASPFGSFSSSPGQSNHRQVSEERIAEAAKDEKFGRGRRVLLVDDSPLILKNVNNLLTKIGFDVVNVNNGAKAFEELTTGLNSKKPIEIVVTDVEMPSMDGLTLTRKIREHEKLSSLPVVLHTSLSGKAIREAADKCGADGYAVKNDFATLVSFLKQAG